MEDKELFMEVFNNLKSHYHRLSMSGRIVCYDDKEKFNTDGYCLAYNLYRLGKVLKDNGEFE
jgi:hypothetical protein